MAAVLGLRSRRELAVVALVSVATNPPLNYFGEVLRRFVDWPAAAAPALVAGMVAAEAVVVIVEWRLLVMALGGSSRRLLGVAIAMNTASALAGAVIWALRIPLPGV